MQVKTRLKKTSESYPFVTGSLKTYIKKRWIQPLYVTWHKTKAFISQFKNQLFFPITLLYIRIYEVITGTMCLDKLSFNTKNSWWNSAELNWSKIMKDCFQAEMVEENNENTSLARKKTINPTRQHSCIFVCSPTTTTNISSKRQSKVQH